MTPVVLCVGVEQKRLGKMVANCLPQHNYKTLFSQGHLLVEQDS